DAPYAVAVRDSAMRMITAVARVGGEPVRLVVDRQLLRIDVRDEEGDVLQGVKIVAEGYDPAGRGTTEHPPPRDPAVGYSVQNPPFSVDAFGRRMLLSPFGWVWRLAIADEDVQPEVQRHEAFAGVWHAERTMVLRLETRFGSLHLVV